MLYAQKDFPSTEIFVVDNGNQQKDGAFRPGVHFYDNPTNAGVAASWNQLCKKIFEKHSHAVILNDDIFWGYGERVIKNFLQDHRKRPLITCSHGFTVFIISEKCYQSVGPFDENFFPAYFEDNDYVYRIKLKGLSVYSTMKIDPYVMRTSESSNKDRSLFENSFYKNKELYISKWGGEPGKEKFKKPFNK